MFIYFERERESEHKWGRGRERERERDRQKIPSRLGSVCPEPNVELELTNCELMT